MKTIVFTVTNDLNYDQRMQRICGSLAHAGYDVLLVGRKHRNSLALNQAAYRQKRLHCWCRSGFLFYAEYNLRLLWYLLFVRMDAVCAIDLDTILPGLCASYLRRKKRVYDAHELFTEMKEVVTRPRIHNVWMAVERLAVPRFPRGYTVSYSIAEEFNRRYSVVYDVIRNLPLKPTDASTQTELTAPVPIVLYQGAVNEARGLENLVLAMGRVEAVLHIYGDGNLYERIKGSITTHGLQHKVVLKGKVLPQALPAITQQAYMCINLVEPVGLNQVYSLANKFFDYIQAGVPQVTMNFPEYRRVNDVHKVAVLVDSVSVAEITAAIERLLHDRLLHQQLKNNCSIAREMYTWQREEQKLVLFYKNIFAR